jgi:hypothetical protein
VNRAKNLAKDLVKDPVHFIWTGNTKLWII